MKIGILTLPPYANYGGILQAYALQNVLQDMGHEVCVLVNEHKFYKPTKEEYVKRMILKLLGKNIIIRAEKKAEKEAPFIFEKLWRFIDTHIKKCNVSKLDDLEASQFDAIVVGSDQIWRPRYFQKLWRCPIQNAFLSFSETWSLKRIAYAASFGVDKWEYDPNQTNLCGKYAKKFDAISVREKSGVRLIKENFALLSECVLDPTMLLCIEKYKSLFKSKALPTHKQGLLNYILDIDNRKVDIINTFAKAKSLDVFSVTNTHVPITASVEKRVMPSVEEWLKGFYDADFVVTDSFHACVFSILFGKPFVAIGNTDRGLGRFKSLLETFGLEDHLCYSEGQIDYNRDYSIPDKVYLILDDLRRKSFGFLQDALTDNKI